MIRPISLHRGDDEPAPRIEANASNINKDSLDCGITAMQCCNSHGCQKLGTTKSFMIVFASIGIWLGAFDRYFAISARQAALQFNYDPVLVDWLLVTSGIVQGAFAILFAYWGNRMHRISWMGTILMFQGLVGLTVIIPILVHSDEQNQALVAVGVNHLCLERTIEDLTDEITYSSTTLAMLFVLQILNGLGNIVFYSLGLSYLDDNVKEAHSPALIGTAVAARIWGSQWGSALAYFVSSTSLGWWLGWAILAPHLFLYAMIVSWFPKRLIKAVVRQAADNIVETATGHSQQSLSPHTLLADTSLFRSLRRVFTNKVLMFNVIAAAFVETAMINFWTHEASYLQSRFFVPTDELGVNDWTSRMFTTFLRPGSVATSVLLGGLIVAKAKPSAKKLAIWNIITGVVVATLFVSYIFLDCHRSPVAGGYNGRLTKPYCSRSCICDQKIRFSPVCPADSIQTYFSPCHAGCADETDVNGIKTFTNCSCGVDTEIVLTASDGIATDGACGYADCQTLWIMFQILTIFGASFLATGVIANLLITIRSVLPQDKALALGTELTFLGLLVYIPGHIGYQAIAKMTCQYWSQDETSVCLLHTSETFGNALNIVSVVLVAIGIFFDVLVFIFVGDMELYGAGDDGEYRLIQMQTFNGEPQQQRFYGDDAAQPFLSQPIVENANNSTTFDAQQPTIATTPDIGNVIRFQLNDPAAPSPSISERMRMSQQSSAMSPTPSNGHTYARVLRQPASDELDFHLQGMSQSNGGQSDQNLRPSEFLRRTYGSDINPSRGNVIESESELDIAQLEASISPISGSPLSSPTGITRTNVTQTQRRGDLSPETDF